MVRVRSSAVVNEEGLATKWVTRRRPGLLDALLRTVTGAAAGGPGYAEGVTVR
jgi:hypothetical protein